MNKVFFIAIGNLKKDYDNLFLSRGISIVRFQSVNSMKYRNEDAPDLILIERQQAKESGFNLFRQKFRNIPKIVISETDSPIGLAPWLKTDFTCPVFNPSEKELDFYIRKAMEEKRLKEDNARLNEKLQSLKKELDFFEEVSKTLTSALDLNAVLGAIMNKAKKLINAEAWSLFVMDESTGELVVEKTTRNKETKKKSKKMRLGIGEGIAGWVAQEQIPVIVPDVSKDPRFSSKTSSGSASKSSSIMCVPILNKNNVLGVLEITNKTTNQPFTKDDLDLILRIVDHAAIAIERSALYQKMTELSITDDLTKLFNTRYMNRTLEIEIGRAARHRTSLALIFMDIDHFKTINDNYGHLIGSRLLVEMGQILLKALRTVDIVARYGGDEFVIVLPQTAPKYAIQIAERMRKIIEHYIFLKKEGYSLKVTASFGVASYPESAKSKEELLKLADDAMYRVKYQTRNGVYAIV